MNKTISMITIALCTTLAGGCMGELGYDTYGEGSDPQAVSPANIPPAPPPAPAPQPQATPPAAGAGHALSAEDQAVLGWLLTTFGQPMRKLNSDPVPSVAVPGSTLDLWVSEKGLDDYRRARIASSGSQIALPEGAVVVRVVRGPDGAVSKYTVLAKREAGFNPPSDLWFGVYDTRGQVAHDSSGGRMEGRIDSCTSCHMTRANDGYIFGMP